MACASLSTQTIIGQHMSMLKGQAEKQCLSCIAPRGPPELRENYGFKLSELNAIETTISGQLAALCAEWSNHHGHY